MVLYLLVNCPPYKDRTLKALIGGFRQLLKSNFHIYDFQDGGFREGSPRFEQDAVCLLYGNLRNYGPQLKSLPESPNMEIIRFLESFPGKRFWITRHDSDLDHYPEDMIMGRKTRYSRPREIERFEYLLNLFDGLVWFGEDLLSNEAPLDLSPNGEKHWSSEYIDFKRNILKQTITELKSRFKMRIEYTHCVSKASIHLGRKTLFHNRRYPIGLVGTLYNTRLYVREVLNDLEIKVTPFDSYEAAVLKLNYAINHLGRIGWGDVRIRNMQRSSRFMSQQLMISQTRMAWVDPGYFGYLVRKYFEFSLAGAMLVGQSNKGIENKGFVKNQNIIESNGKSFSDIIHIDEVERKILVNNNLDMIEQVHTGLARANQIFNATVDNAGEYVFSFRSGQFVRIS
jgi:hypothetical protein